MEKKTKLDEWFQKNTVHSTEKTNFKKKFKNPFRSKSDKKLKLVFLGGLDEIGKNMMLLEYGNDIIALDMGLKFPEEDMLGVDYIVPDTAYLERNLNKLRGILITHGHLDHIGAITYLTPKLKNPTYYSLKLTNGLIGKHLKEHKMEKMAKLVNVKPKETFKLGVFKITYFRVNHSIPDSCGIAIETPEGLIVHTGDFKFDFTPSDGVMADMDYMKELGEKKVLLLMSDSTNSIKEGHTMSEKVVGDELEKIIKSAPDRLIISCFSSVIGRMQNIIDAAKATNKRIFISGRSLVNNVKIATQLGYLKYPKGMIAELRRNSKGSQAKNALILTTGSQGESLSGLTRMAMGEHRQIKLTKKDTIVYSSSPIIGNERSINAVINVLIRKVANVITNKHMDVHTSGHGNIEDLKMMINFIKPKFFVPVHGEYYHRFYHKKLALEEGIPKENIFLLENGKVLELSKGKAFVAKKDVPTNYIMVDNQAPKLCNVASEIVSERQSMSLNGVILINVVMESKRPVMKSLSISSKGFIYMKSTEKVLKDVEAESKKLINMHLKGRKRVNKGELEAFLKSALDRVVTKNLQRRPLVIPNILFVN
ncbi:ribonuclease J [bacterium]|nr:ribonuclease J [bacterium]|tara:strand:+ start:2682 stop:4463 length:1782 start_codon:yes stop_codon:yes gene_type:complete